MKSKSKKHQRLASTFLRDLRDKNEFRFDRISQVLEKYDSGDLDSKNVVRSIVRELQPDTGLIDRVNELLDEEHRVVFITDRQSINMMTRLFEIMQREVTDRDKFAKFLNVVNEAAERLEKAQSTSLEELGEFVVEEVRMAAPLSFWGNSFFEALNYALKECVLSEKNSRNGPVNDRVLASQQSLPSQPERQPAEQVKPPKADQHDVQNGKRKTKHQPSAPHLNGAQPQVQPPLITQPPNLDHSPSVSPDEPHLFNLRIEAEVFMCLKTKLSPESYLKFVKVLSMFAQSIISFHELVFLTESILLTLDKELCMALREMIDSRHSQVCRVSPFNIRLAKIRSNDPGHNRKYFKIIAPIFGADQSNDSIINKTYLAITSGHESDGTFEESTAARHHKNVSEEVLHKAEDEMHEMDCTLAQFRNTRVLLDKLLTPGITEEQYQKICQRISSIRTLFLLYGNKNNQILNEIRNRHKRIIEVVKERIEERIKRLELAKKQIYERSWTERLFSAFYKALDSRSTNLKVQERHAINNKTFVDKLKAAGPGAPLIKTWLGKLIDPSCEVAGASLPRLSAESPCWNPVFGMRLLDKQILSDVYQLLKVFIRQSKSNNNEKTKYNNFVDIAFGAFFSIPVPAELRVEPIAADVLAGTLSQLERLIYPQKQFYFSDKVQIKLNLDAYQVVEDFNSSSADEEEEKMNGEGTAGQGPTLGTDCPADQKGAFAAESVTGQPMETEHLLQDHTSSDREEEHIEGSDISRDFQKLLNSNNSDEVHGEEVVIELVPADLANHSFYASYHFYVVYQFFILLFERFSFVCEFAQKSPAAAPIYTIFKQLLYMELFGIVDEAGYEDAIRMIFGHCGGVLLNFERILAGCLKNIPSDDISNFVFGLNPQSFGQNTESLVLPESVVFARTCFKLNEMNAKDNKGYKANSFTAFNNNYSLTGAELVKLEYNLEGGLFVVHKVRSMFPDGKKSAGSNDQLIESNYSLLTRVVDTKNRKSAKVRKLIANHLTYNFDAKRRAVQVRSGDADDVLLAPHQGTPVETRKHRISKAQKTRLFRELLAKFYAEPTGIAAQGGRS